MGARCQPARAAVHVLETERLRLRRLSVEDAAFILELLNDTAFIRYIGDKGVRTTTDARRYISQGPVSSYDRFGYGLYLVEQKDDGKSLGVCGLLKRDYLAHADLGFAFLPRFRSQGYAFESASAVLTYARTVCGLKRIAAFTSADNTGSIALLTKLGFRFERMVRLAANEPEVRLFISDAPADQSGAMT